MRSFACALLLVGGATGLLATPSVADAKGVVLSFVEGRAELAPQKSPTRFVRVKSGAAVADGDVVRTSAKSRAELSFPDGSKVRIGPDSRLTVSAAKFVDGARRKVSLRLWVGALWANVAKAVSGASTFEVRTDNAVGGVRGTSFAVLAAADASAIVRVYAGAVGVRPALGEGKNRRRIAGPRRIDRQQWEEIIATAMKEVRISALGDIAPAADFESADSWAKWNQARDKKAPAHK